MAFAIGGFMATGKTTIGRDLADHLGWPFHDLDVVVNSLCMKELASSISELIEQGQEELFRKMEHRCVLDWMSTLPEASIVALGGGTLHNKGLGRHIKEHHRLVVLHAKWDFIKERIVNSKRPLRHTAEHLFVEREEGYRCGVQFCVENKSVSVCVQELNQLIQGNHDVN